MPLIEVHVIENVFNAEQKRQMISKLTDAMVSVSLLIIWRFCSALNTFSMTWTSINGI